MNKPKDVNDVVRAGGRFTGRGEPVGRGTSDRRKVALSELVLEKRCQTRAAADNAVIAEYAEAYEAKLEMPAIDAFEVGKKLIVTDGFHRVAACVKARVAFVEVLVVGRGSMDDAALRALGANRAHGLRRSNADKRRAVMLAIEHPKLKGKSDRELAEVCGVGYTLVADVREELDKGWDAPSKPAKSLGRDRSSAGLGRQVPDSGTWKANPARSLDPDPRPERREGKDGKMYPVPAKPSNGVTPRPPPPAPAAAGPDTTPWDDAAGAVQYARLELQKIERENGLKVGQRLRTAIDQLAAIEAGIERDAPVKCPRCGGLLGDCSACKGKHVVTRARAEQLREGRA